MKKSTAILTAVLFAGTTAFSGNVQPIKRALLQKEIITANADTGQTQVEYSTVPANIQYAVKEQYPNFEPQKMATKVVAEGQTIYYVTVESSSRVIGLRCNTDGEIIMQSSSKK